MARILRIDPRAGVAAGAPILTTVLELVRHRHLRDIKAKCTAVTGTANNLSCMAAELRQPGALYQAVPFPDKDAIFTVEVGGRDVPAALTSVATWGASQQQPGVGTAWLIAIDGASSMGARLADARHFAKELIAAMGPQDIVEVMFFNDRAVVKDSAWLADKVAATSFVDSVANTYPPQGRSRQLAAMVHDAASSGFHQLGSPGGTIKAPLHQAMVVLSNGASGVSGSSAVATAMTLRHYLSKGRFPDDRSALPKSPTPIVSVWFPTRQIEEHFRDSWQFMESLANPEIGGHFSILREGDEGQASQIVSVVRQRFDQMHIVKWRVRCVAPTPEQSFKLLFRPTQPLIVGDSFGRAPVGLDPATWPGQGPCGP